MKKAFLVVNVVLIVFVIALLEGVAFLVIKGNLGEFDLATQGGTTMKESMYQVWEHPANYKSWSGKTEFNQQAFRRREDLTTPAPKNTTRIFIMGGSAAFGSQAMPGSIYLQLSGQGEYKNELTIAAQLEQKLNQQYPAKNFEVINAATNWSRIHQQMIHYLRKIRKLEPDLVISMDAYNDSTAIENNNAWSDTAKIANQTLFGNIKHEISPIFQKSYSAYLAAMLIFRTGGSVEPDQSLLAKYSQYKMPEDFQQQLDAAAQSDKNTLDGIINEYMSSLHYFDAVLDQDKVPHMFYLQPLAVLDNNKPHTRIEKAIRGYQWSKLNTEQLTRINFFKAIEKNGRKLDSSGEIEFGSMLDIFSQVKGNVYSDYCHFTPLGNERIAEFFLKQIQTRHPEILN